MVALRAGRVCSGAVPRAWRLLCRTHPPHPATPELRAEQGGSPAAAPDVSALRATFAALIDCGRRCSGEGSSVQGSYVVQSWMLPRNSNCTDSARRPRAQLCRVSLRDVIVPRFDDDACCKSDFWLFWGAAAPLIRPNTGRCWGNHFSKVMFGKVIATADKTRPKALL